MNLDFDYIVLIFPKVLAYLPTTLWMALISMLFAMSIGLMLALIKLKGVRVINAIIDFYISIFRGIPTLVQLFLIYFGLPQLFPILNGIDAITAAIIGFSLKNSAYMAEIYRAGLSSVEFGQMEAGLTIGMTRGQVFRRIIIPQAMLNTLPATGNTFISLIKETSVAFALGVTELFAEGKMIAAESLRYFETFIVVGVIYWLTVVVYGWIQSFIESKLRYGLDR
ncbi:amino acid ABC transporter permease [Thorsellia anophelis]|uniref:Glutamate/aspartate import permease protein GltK n=1 Tax=Thorsellia anophelis DSM 18579 TaxID=1123402 RepID=A0A1I0DZT3_9GAMM|nr:amino acid ABC transporter permease [Thorsellia anophelis]SET38108.1 amino acid ABC transporter membrane protein, PAAT family (TC 3.A.1.3.-) [Thorsellia anophelis DSM 18579]